MAKKRKRRFPAETPDQLEAVKKGYRLPECPEHKSNKLITPLGLERISEMYLTGYSNADIAREVGITGEGVAYHIKTNCRNLWKTRMDFGVDRELERIAQMEKEAWAGFRRSQGNETSEQIEETLVDTDDSETLQLSKRIIKDLKRDGNTCWMGVIQWCVDFRAKCGGYYKDPATNPNDIRVAGKTPEELQAELTERILKRLEERNIEAEE